MKHAFHLWMMRINNIYYSDDNKMANAFQVIENYEKIQRKKLHQVQRGFEKIYAGR